MYSLMPGRGDIRILSQKMPSVYVIEDSLGLLCDFLSSDECELLIGLVLGAVCLDLTQVMHAEEAANATLERIAKRPAPSQRSQKYSLLSPAAMRAQSEPADYVMAGAVTALLATREADGFLGPEEDSDLDGLSDFSFEEELLASSVQLSTDTVETTWELEVRKLSGESLMLAVHSGMPVSELSRAIEVHLGISQHCQRWIAGEQVLPWRQGPHSLVARVLENVPELTVIHIGHEPLNPLPSRFDVKLIAFNMKAAYRDSSRVSLFRIRADTPNRQMTVQRSTRNHSETYMYDMEKKSAKYSGGHCLCVPSHSATPLDKDLLSDFVGRWQDTSDVDSRLLWRLPGDEAENRFWCDPFMSPCEDYVEVKVDVAIGTLKAKIVRFLIDGDGKPIRAAVKHDGSFLHEYTVEVIEWDPQADAGCG
ncbi:unnamed protein product [Symbiodinium natans]|uniref:Uncharacterized protein n=1 Tax=Symbiodinium natans TaxID=878477 RepID=A0A812PSK5_9DINO|nr:unnamed protein product [Symbiodinium natans]